MIKPDLRDILKAGMPVYRPIAGWGITITLGIALGYHWAAPLPFLLLATFFWIAQFVFRNRSLVLLMALFFLAAAWGARSGMRYHETCARINAARGEDITLRVKIPDTVRISRPQTRAPSCRFTTSDFSFEDGFRAENTVLRTAFHCRKSDFPFRLPEPGERWLLHGHWMRWEHDRLEFSVSAAEAECLQPADSYSVSYQLGRLRARLAQHLALGLEPGESALLQTITIGSRHPLPYALRQKLGGGGIIHIFAISGLHVGIVAGFFLFLLRTVYCPFRFRWMALLPLLCAYLVIIGAPPSAARACLMAVICFASPFFLRRTDAASAFFLTAITVFTLEPAWVFSVSAQLSFSVIAGLLLMMPPLAYFLFQWCGVLHNFGDEPDPVARRGTTPLRTRLIRIPLTILALDLAAWLSSVPLSMLYFGQLSIAGLLLNLLAPTVALIVVWLSCISAAAGFFAPAISIALNRVGATLLEWLIKAAEKVCTWPGMVIQVEPSLWMILLLLSALVFLGFWLRGKAFYARLNDPKNRDYSGLGPIINEDSFDSDEPSEKSSVTG